MKISILPSIKKNIFNLCEKLLRSFPDELFGSTAKLREIYEKRYWRKDIDDVVNEVRLKMAMRYLCVLLFLLIITLPALFEGLNGSTGITKIERPEYGSNSRMQRFTVELQYKKETLDKKISVRIAPRVLTDRQINEKLEAFSDALPKKILGKNKDLDHVTTDLILIGEDPESGIKAEWSSDSPEILSNSGQIDSIAIKEFKAKKTDKTGINNAEEAVGRIVKLTAVYSLKGQERETSFLIRILPEPESNDRKALEDRLQGMVKNLEKTASSQPTVALPVDLPGEIKIKWNRERGISVPEVILVTIAALLSIYLLRYRQAKNELKTDSEAILRDLPEFVNKLVLLLSAGLVTETAVMKITGDYQKHVGLRKKPLYEGFCEIEKRMLETNASFLKELRIFAQKSDVRELIRFSNILDENIHTGNSLSEKLEGEAAMLWFYRKKNAEEKGRLAETKLTFPLVIQLLVLMMITLAPVFLKI